MNRIRRLFAKVQTWIIDFCILVVSTISALQVGSWLVLLTIGYGEIPSRDIVTGVDRNAHLSFNSSCKDYSVGLQLHPYLAFTHNNCYMLNELGYTGDSLDYDNENLHRIGIFGGSTASQFAGIVLPQSDEAEFNSFFSRYLNQCFESREGKSSFRVLNFADGAWKHPTQGIALLLYGDYLDTAISIEGFNETYPFSWTGTDLAWPAQNNFSVAVLNASNVTLGNALLPRLYRHLKGTWVEDLSVTRLSLLAARAAIREIGMELRPSSDGWGLELKKLAEYKPNKVKNSTRYEHFVRAFLAIAREKNIEGFVVLQPSPISKPLTSGERKRVKYVDYKNTYSVMRNILKTIPNTIDLSDLFAKHSGDIFSDDIHFIRSQSDVKAKRMGHSEGDKIMARALMKEIMRISPGSFIKKAQCD